MSSEPGMCGTLPSSFFVGAKVSRGGLKVLYKLDILDNTGVD